MRETSTLFCRVGEDWSSGGNILHVPFGTVHLLLDSAVQKQRARAPAAASAACCRSKVDMKCVSSRSRRPSMTQSFKHASNVHASLCTGSCSGHAEHYAPYPLDLAAIRRCRIWHRSDCSVSAEAPWKLEEEPLIIATIGLADDQEWRIPATNEGWGGGCCVSLFRAHS